MTKSTVWTFLFLLWNVHQFTKSFQEKLPDTTDVSKHGHVTSVPSYMVMRQHITQIRFQCYIDGLPAKNGETIWIRNNRTLQCNLTNRVFACFNIIIITDVIMEDAGHYTCMTVGKNTTTTSVTATIYVPALFTNPDTEFLTVKVGDSIDLYSPVSNLSFPQPAYVLWRKTGYYIAEGKTLHLRNMSENTTGLYESVVFNGFGEPAVKSYHVSLSERSMTSNSSYPTLMTENYDIQMPTVEDNVLESVAYSGSNHGYTLFRYIELAAITMIL